MDQQPFIFRRGPYEIFILLLTLLALANGAVLFIWPDETWSSVLRYMDWFISVLFFADFFWLLREAKDKRGYFIRGWGWADLLGSFPIPGFRLFRLIREALFRGGSAPKGWWDYGVGCGASSRRARCFSSPSG